MNIALSAVVIFILLLPPIAFYLSFTFGRFAKTGPKLGLLEGLMLSAIFSILLHGIALYFIKTETRFDVLALLLGGDLKGFNATLTNAVFKNLFLAFVRYNSLLVFFSVLAGTCARWIVNKTGLHAKLELIRLYNRWWYLFQGYKVDEFNNQPALPDFDIVFVDVLVNTNAGTVIYSGYLVDFVCSGETLDRIYLSETIKREFKQNSGSGEARAIDGETMVIPYSNIINMNLHFVSFPEDMESVPGAEISVPEGQEKGD